MSSDAIIKKLHTQAVAKVEKELEAEKAGRIEKYLRRAVSVLVQEDVLSAQEANVACRKLGITLSLPVANKAAMAVTGPSSPSSGGGCGGMSSGNRC